MTLLERLRWRRLRDAVGPDELAGTFVCPRRREAPFALPGDDGVDRWLNGGALGRCCSYCGSEPPEQLLPMLEAGYSVGPTDKAYKIYVGGAQGYHAKFYTQHFELRPDLAIRFRLLWVAGRLVFDYPGHFYRRLYLPLPDDYADPDPQGAPA